jgi:hypothetical protein
MRQGSEMSIQCPKYVFDAEDQQTYVVWLRRTLMAYGAMVLFAVALVTVQAMTHAANVAEFAAAAIPVTGP